MALGGLATQKTLDLNRPHLAASGGHIHRKEQGDEELNRCLRWLRLKRESRIDFVRTIEANTDVAAIID
jgi:hypothetical protein